MVRVAIWPMSGGQNRRCGLGGWWSSQSLRLLVCLMLCIHGSIWTDRCVWTETDAAEHKEWGKMAIAHVPGGEPRDVGGVCFLLEQPLVGMDGPRGIPRSGRSKLLNMVARIAAG